MDSNSSDDQNVSLETISAHIGRYRTLLLTDIDSEDQTFRITTCNDNEDLLRSIRQIGLIQPPLLMANSGRYSIVCGFRRVAACRQAGWIRMAAGVLRESTDRFTAAQLSIADNAFQRSLNLVEISRALKLLDDFGTNDTQRQNAAAALGLPTSPSVTPDLKRICRLPLPVQEGILTGSIDLSMALELGGLDPSDAAEVVGLFEQLRVGLNKQRELLLYLKEIAAREDTSISQLLAAESLQRILSDTDMDRAVQRQNVRAYLRQCRFPAITRAESDYRRWVKQLKLGKHIDLTPPRDFEGNTFHMTLRFQNRKELSDLKSRLDKIIENPALGKILDG